MSTLDFRTFNSLSRKGNLVAVTHSVPADLETPVSAYLKLSQHQPHAFLLESAEQEEKIGRYSFIGIHPELVILENNSKVFLIRGHQKKLLPSGTSLLDWIQTDMTGRKLANPEALPEFCGGYVGYLGYENVSKFESIKLRKGKSGPGFPESIFFLSQELVIFDHFRKNLTVCVIKEIKAGKSIKSAYLSAVQRIQDYIKQLQKPLPLDKSKTKQVPLKLKANMSPEAFKKKVGKIKQYIRAGDCIQVVLSQRFTNPAIPNDFHIYRALRSVNPSPYMFYFKADAFRLVGSSPELLVRKNGRTAEVRPIAGTRPRGKNPQEDLKLEDDLKKSIKEKAEHLMLVDLGRNDIGRVCEFSSVKVDRFARVERYSHVMHLVSDVQGKLKSGKSAFDLLRSTFPAGTVSGAPKIRAMQIIDELEDEQRGPYAGCLGYFSFTGDMDMCITIRTLFTDGKQLYLQAGAGIVQDSNPAKEYQETLNKARALVKAIEMRGQF